jgi:predicted phosphoribosyltransferase
MFRDRADAGRQLAAELRRRAVEPALVLGIPRGGVEIGREAAQALDCGLSALVVRKLPFPDNPEAGFGAVAEDGSLFLLPDLAGRLSRRTIAGVIAAQREEVSRRIRVMRGGAALPDLKGRDVVIVDDGIAMGSTALAAVQCCRRLGARRVTAAAPVASLQANALLEKSADEVVILLTPPDFRAVAEYYANWSDVPEEEVLRILDRTSRPKV